MQTIPELEHKLKELPLLPTVLVRLLQLDRNDDKYFEKVYRLSQEDPTFALRIIRLSNSASSAPISPITNLRDAIIRLGVKTVTGLVTSMSALRVFIPTTQGEKNLWIHSIQVAVGARIISRISEITPKLDPELAYLCGLMHDIGRFVLFEKESGNLNLVDESNWKSPEQLVTTESKLYGFNHAELGSHVCTKWGLPQVIIDVVSNHHNYELKSIKSSNPTLYSLIPIIQVADFFSVFMMLNPDALKGQLHEVENQLHEKCIQSSSSKPPITANQLLTHAQSIIDESNQLIKGLGF